MPAPYSPLPSQNEIRQSRMLFLGANRFSVSGTSTLTRSAKGIYYWVQAASLTVNYFANLDLPFINFNPARLNYAQNNQNYANFALRSVTALYLAAGAALTSATIGVNESTYGAAATPTVVDVIAPSALLLPTNANIQAVTITPSNNKLIPFNPAEINIEAIFQTAAGATLQFYGAYAEILYTR